MHRAIPGFAEFTQSPNEPGFMAPAGPFGSTSGLVTCLFLWVYVPHPQLACRINTPNWYSAKACFYIRVTPNPQNAWYRSNYQGHKIVIGKSLDCSRRQWILQQLFQLASFKLPDYACDVVTMLLLEYIHQIGSLANDFPWTAICTWLLGNPRLLPLGCKTRRSLYLGLSPSSQATG